jgi:hypothetical protein
VEPDFSSEPSNSPICFSLSGRALPIYLATRGEYGAVDVEAEVRRLSERVGTQWAAERT